jgi:glycosyltransferase involved in cell wall biosynthesis
MKAGNPNTQFTTETLARMIAENVDRRLLDANGDCAATVGSALLPSLTVAVCTRDRRADLGRSLNALLRVRASTPPGLEQFEILVVDNAPSDGGTQRLVSTLPGVRYAREPKPGLNFARNRALRESAAEMLAYIDDDVIVDDGWLDGLHAAWAGNRDAAFFTGPILPQELVSDAQVLFEERGGFSHNFAKTRLNPEDKVRDRYYYGFGCNMVVKRQAVLEIGGFDEALDTGRPLPGGGDLDIGYRLLRAGHPLVSDPRLLVFHRHRREYRELRRQLWTWGLTFMTFMAKCHRTDPSQRPQCRREIRYWFGLMLLDLLPAVVVGRRGRRWVPGLTLAEVSGGILGLCNQYGRSQRRIEQIRRQHALEGAG